MGRYVPYLTEETIERDAAALLAEFEIARAVRLEPPIPIEDIVEKHLRLRIEFDSMHARLGLPRPPSGGTVILAAIDSDGSIFIDESLDPEENPAMEGRYRFTLAHESGHWRLHRDMIMDGVMQASFLDGPSLISRSGAAKAREEWQADYYAACLLMPRRMVAAIWGEHFPDGRQRVLQSSVANSPGFVEVPRLYTQIDGRDVLETDDEALERFCKPLAERFLVSPIAMRIRLEHLGLLHRHVPDQWHVSDETAPF
jgi:Zn-dependent peptidase ImmA (M78 family)